MLDTFWESGMRDAGWESEMLDAGWESGNWIDALKMRKRPTTDSLKKGISQDLMDVPIRMAASAPKGA